MLKEIPAAACAGNNGLPMQVGLNILLQHQTGLAADRADRAGHPKQILSALTQESHAAGSICRPRRACWMPVNSVSPATATTKIGDQLAASTLSRPVKSDTYRPEADGRWKSMAQDLPQRSLLPPSQGEADVALLSPHKSYRIAGRTTSSQRLYKTQDWRRCGCRRTRAAASANEG